MVECILFLLVYIGYFMYHSCSLFRLTAVHLSVVAVLGLLGVQSAAYANNFTTPFQVTDEDSQTLAKPDFQKAISDISDQQNIQQATQSLQTSSLNDVAQPTATLVAIDADWTTEQIYAYLEQNPEAFERLLLQSIARSDVVALKALLPAYDRYPQKDPSVVDWGNALIALGRGDAKTAVALFRQINAALPDIRLLRVQMASALYQNKQINAAKDELQKLLREDISDKDRAEINGYISAMDRLDKWNYSVNLSFVKDGNLEDAPPVGTRLSQGLSSLTYTTPHESGTGFSYNLGADKKWSYDNNMFTSASVGLGGVYYWDNQKYNDLYLSLSAGLGYQTAIGHVEVAPVYNRSWYGGGISGNDEGLKSYTSSTGVRFSGSRWLNPNLMYQNTTQFTDLSYEEPYQNNDGEIYSMTNGFFYAPSAKQYYSVNWSLSKKDGVNESDSYERSGVNIGWHNTWRKGVATLFTVGIASKKYDDIDFANIKRHNKEYNAGLSIWKRDWSVFGLTPRLNISVKETNSNSPFEESSETNATVIFTKTF